MTFIVLDTYSTYRRLLAARDAAEREAIFSAELVQPFAGLVAIMGGGGDGAGMFRQWGMSPDMFAGPQAEQTARHVEALAAADAWNKAARALDDGQAAFAHVTDRVPQRDVVFGLMLADLSNVPLQRGYSGFGAIPGWIMTIYGVPDDYNLYRLQAATVHELHHNLLARVFPVNMMTWTVGEYMVMEGLAESFAAELYGEDTIGYWVTDFDYSRLEDTKRRIRDALDVTGFNQIRGYIFGDDMAGVSGIQKVGVPAFAGYAIGYHLVQAYLKRTGKCVADATFIPARQIIAESGYLD